VQNISELRVKYEKLQPINGVSEEMINKIQESLSVEFPRDFYEIASFYGGGGLGAIDVHCFEHTSDDVNIVDETIKLRECVDVPQNFVVLAELDESIIFMDTENLPAIIWCGFEDIHQLNKREFSTKPTVWNTFADFFKQLLDDEEHEISMYGPMNEIQEKYYDSSGTPYA